MCVKSIDITAKSGANSAVVSLRQNELISNLRALVAVRFERAINNIVMVFGGQVLQDVGTIDGHGITSGVTVHVVVRPMPPKLIPVPDEAPAAEMPAAIPRTLGRVYRLTLPGSVAGCEASAADISSLRTSVSSASAKLRSWLTKSREIFHTLLDDPGTLRDVLQGDPRIKNMIDENLTLRHYLNSDRNLRELVSTAFNPAKLQELGRKRDMYMMRLEWIPGGYDMLGRVNYHMRQAQEDSVARKYKENQLGSHPQLAADNPQRGRENKLPLPNPWSRKKRPCRDDFSNTLTNLKQKCDHLVQSLKSGDMYKSLENARALHAIADNARRKIEFAANGDNNDLVRAGRLTALSSEIRKRVEKVTASNLGADETSETAETPEISEILETPPPTAGTAQIAQIAQTEMLPESSTTLKASSTFVPSSGALPSTAISLNLYDFMSSNDNRWEQHFRQQLLELSTLGYNDRQRNICALLMSFGDTRTAVKLLDQWNR